jgi:hypothetical protein
MINGDSVMALSDRIIFNGDRINIHLFTGEYPIVEVKDIVNNCASEYFDLAIAIPGLTTEENAWVASKYHYIASWIEKGHHENVLQNL